MRTPPKLPYSGLTIVLDAPSRFDVKHDRLATEPVRSWLNSFLPDPHQVDSIDFRTIDCVDEPLNKTNYIIAAGAKAAAWIARAHIDPPGYVVLSPQGIPVLPIFSLQECCDYRSSVEEDHEVATDHDTKDITPTRFANKRFWTMWHIIKFLSVSPPSYPSIVPHVYPNLDQQVSLLNSIKSGFLYLDIETSRLHRSLSCIGWTTDELFPNIYVVPVYLFNGALAYKEFHRFFRSFSLALSRTTVVIHNAAFDIPVLNAFYKFAQPKDVYDTYIAQHRIFPEAEKSLGHTISCWTFLSYHKDANLEPFSFEQEKNLWIYNARDVYALPIIKKEQEAYSRNVEGLIPSITQANSSFLPYYNTTLTGLRLDTLRLAATQKRLRTHAQLYTRMSAILTGIPSFNPGSSSQCAAFLHNTLNYPVQGRTPQGKPATGSKQLYSLAAKYDNPLLSVILKYREASKDASMLESKLWTLP